MACPLANSIQPDDVVKQARSLQQCVLAYFSPSHVQRSLKGHTCERDFPLNRKHHSAEQLDLSSLDMMHALHLEICSIYDCVDGQRGFSQIQLKRFVATCRHISLSRRTRNYAAIELTFRHSNLGIDGSNGI